MYNETVINGVRYVITGGAGASLYADEEHGGIYHYMNVTLKEGILTIEPVLLDIPTLPRDSVVIKGLDEDVTLSLGNLLEMETVTRFSSFQNQYDNWRGQGIYSGVAISDLIDLVGGMAVNDTLIVQSLDGYTQEFGYANVYPNTTWVEIQGPMVLAYSYNDTMVLDWTDGMRLVMMPSDGGYSNLDANQTSVSGDVISGGTRWVRFVSSIEVISG